MFSNCFLYNSDPNNFAHKKGKSLQSYYIKQWNDLSMDFYRPIKPDEIKLAASISPNEVSN